MPNSSNIPAFLDMMKRRAMERDKQQHAALSYCLALLFFFIIPSLPVAAISTMTLGLCKEIWDKYQGTGFCWYDMLANAVGTSAGMVTIVVVTG